MEVAPAAAADFAETIPVQPLRQAATADKITIQSPNKNREKNSPLTLQLIPFGSLIVSTFSSW
jgi:hypothetical protein